MLCLRLRLGRARLQTLLFGLGMLRLGAARLRMLLFLLRPQRLSRRRCLLLELLPGDSLTRPVAIVAGSNRVLLLYCLGIARP